MSILVAESNEHIRDVLAVILEAEGYEVARASTWLEALYALKRRPDIELALVDVMLPSLDIWQLEPRIASASRVRNAPVVMMTGSSEPSWREGMQVLRKPFDMHQLLEIVRAQVAPRSHRARTRSQQTPRSQVRKRRLKSA